ncbi:MAG TPA: Crp/Fnr family transcriptional regulator [Vicinamibacterales bacterium]|nr:Crp/Fnr family transcriptional regulator [Vicinamibacterales bacterium]
MDLSVRGQMMDDSFAVEALARCPLFENASRDMLESLANRLRRRRFRRNEVIFHQGDPGDSLHVVASGAVKILLPSAEGEEAIIATLRPGDFFGELALLDGATRSATAAAVEPTETLVLPRSVLMDLLATVPGLGDRLLVGLAKELRRLTSQVEELYFLDLAGRLAMRLTRLAEESQPDTRGQIRLSWPYTQSDLAAMIGGTRQSVNKLLSQLVEEGFIQIEPDALVITDLDALARRAER